MERQIENMVGDKAAHVLKRVNALAAKQNGGSTLENHQLLGKRALIGFCATVAVAQVAISTVGFVVSRKTEEQRIERIVRRVLAEEREA